MNFEEAIEYLYQTLPMYQRVGKVAYKKDLTNTLKLCDILGNPQNKFKSVHIAGTNGKGSSAHMISAILQSAGYKVGLYTSPHLKSFTERIKISGEEIPKKQVVQFVEKIRPNIEDIQPSFFEITVALAFDYFAKQEVDIAIIETGLGGRLDSTNVITPIVSLITNIGEDHQDMLGDTLEKIAKEKAGIIKSKVPIVIGELQTEIVSVFQKVAIENKSELQFASDKYRVICDSHTIDILENGNPRISNVAPQLKGTYQNNNLPGVLGVIDKLNEQGFNISDKHVIDGIEQVVDFTGLKGRWHIHGIAPLTICDTAHNLEGIKLVLKQLQSLKFNELHIVWGMVNDKSIDAILDVLPKEAHFYFCQANVPRALPASELHKAAITANLKGDVIADVNLAIQSARSKAQTNDVIFIGGSTFVVAEIDNL